MGLKPGVSQQIIRTKTESSKSNMGLKPSVSEQLLKANVEKANFKPSVSQRVTQIRIEQTKPKTVEAIVVPITGGRVIGGTISQTSQTGPTVGQPSFVVGGVRMGGKVVGNNTIPFGEVRTKQRKVQISTAPIGGTVKGGRKIVSTIKVRGQEIPVQEQMMTQEFVESGQVKMPVPSGGQFNIVRQKVPIKRDENAKQWFAGRTAPRGAAAKGVISQNVEGQIVGLRVPASQAGMISGATVIGRTGVREVPVINTGPRLRIKEIVQEIQPVEFSTETQGSGGGTVVETQRRVKSRLVPGQTTGTFSKTVQVQGGGAGGLEGAASLGGAAGGASGRWSLSGQGTGVRFGGGSGVGREGVAGRTVEILPADSGMAGGDFTQMGKVFGTGGGIKRVIDTNMRRVPAGAVQMETQGGVDLASLGLGGAEGSNIIRRTVQLSGPGDAGGSAGGAMFSTSGGNFIDAGTVGGAGGGEFISQGTVTGGGSGLRNNPNDMMFLTGFTRDSAENLLDGFGGKRRRRRSASAKSRSKRATNKQAYQALVTNCQGQGVQGPSIMIVANNGEVQFAVKTTDFENPGIVAVPAVSSLLLSLQFMIKIEPHHEQTCLRGFE